MWTIAALALIAVAPMQIQQPAHIGAMTERLRGPAHVASASDGSVFVTDPITNRVSRFDAALSLTDSWDVSEGPIGIAVHPDGRVLVSLRDIPGVAIYDATFARIGLLGSSEPAVVYVKPTDVGVDDVTGRIYVVDSGSDQIVGFDSAGNLALILGMRGGLNGQFRYPSAIGVDSQLGRLIIGDHDNFRIQVFDSSGIFSFRFGYRIKYLPGGSEEGWMPRTLGLTVDAAGNVYVADALMNTVRVFDPMGTELGTILDRADIEAPCGLTLSSDGSRLYVVSADTSSVEVFETPSILGLRQAARSHSATELVSLGALGTNDCELDTERNEAMVPAPSSTAATNTTRPTTRGSQRKTSRSTDVSQVPAAQQASGFDGPHMIDSDIVCGRCHGVDGQPGGHPGLAEGQYVLCVSCHAAGGQALSVPLHQWDAADPYSSNPLAADGRGRSHAWNVPASNSSADSVGPMAGGAMAEHLDGGLMKCSTCHDQHTDVLSSPYLRIRNGQDQMCKECHAARDKGPGEGGTHPVGFDYPGGVGEFPADTALMPLLLKGANVECMTCHGVHGADSGGANLGEGDGMLLRKSNDETLCRTCHADHIGHTPGGSWQPTCRDCHAVHDPDNPNLALVASGIRNQTLAQDFPVTFVSRLGAGSFADGDAVALDGVCEVCHTATDHHRYDGTGSEHNPGTTCTDCHPHNAGFMPTGGDCTSCHSSVQDNGDGIPLGGRRAVVGEFPVADAHSHYGVELDSDSCQVCHDVTTHMDGYVELIDPDDGTIYRFVYAADLSGDPDVSNFCTGCHDVDGATRLATPFDPFGQPAGDAPFDVATKFQGTLAWIEWYGDSCFGAEGTSRAVNSHHDISDVDQAFSGAKLECLNCHGAHTSSASQKTADPYNPTAAWTGSKNEFCLSCHAGGNGPLDPAFPNGVVGPAVALRGLDTCDYQDPMWYVDYTWTHSAHGPISKRTWDGYSGAPAADLDCVICHDPHGSYTPTNTVGNPYMIRDIVDGTAFVDDGTRTGGFNGPPWDTYGVSRPVTVPISGIDVDWGSPTSLCSACHADWQAAYSWHDFCTGCQTCHNHGMAFGEADFVGTDDSVACPAARSAADAISAPPMETTHRLSDDSENPILHLWDADQPRPSR